jgi:hypothetical protein
MLHRADDPALGLRPVERDPQRLTRAAGEDQLPLPAERALASLARILQRLLGPAPLGMRGGGLAQMRKPSSIAACASGRRGEVAAWSR